MLPDGATVQTLIEMFGDPVVDPKRGVVTFLYKEGIILVVSRNITKTAKSVEVLQEVLSKNKGPAALVAIDLGQTNPVGVGVYRLTGEDLRYEVVSRFALPDVLTHQISEYRQRTDAFEAKVREETLALMTTEEQSEIKRVQAFSAQSAKENACLRFGLLPDAVDWSSMDSWSHHISNWVSSHGDPESVMVQDYGKENKIKLDKKGNPKKVALTDSRIANLSGVRLRWSKSTRDHYNNVMFKLRFQHPDYAILARSKSELSRRVVNWVIGKVRKRVSSQVQIIFILEDLKNLGKVFHGKGKRSIGWDSFFEPKSENRWFIAALHKAFSETSQHKGHHVIEVSPRWTSRTCPKCRFCHMDNRKGEVFRCLSCGHECNTDYETAPDNLAFIATTGKGLPGPKKSERSGDEKSPDLSQAQTFCN